MIDVALLIADMVRAGVDPDLIGRTAAALAESGHEKPQPSSRQERNRRYYDAKRLKASDDASCSDGERLNKTQNVLKRLNSDAPPHPPIPDKEKSPTPPKEINPSPLTPHAPPKARAGFEEFWACYPHKVGKRDASKAFDRAMARASLDSVMSGLRRYAAKRDDRPWCNPATFLNQDRWTDEPGLALPRSGAPPGRPVMLADVTADLLGRNGHGATGTFERTIESGLAGGVDGATAHLVHLVADQGRG